MGESFQYSRIKDFEADFLKDSLKILKIKIASDLFSIYF